MFSINDHVFYGMTGVCQVADIRTERFGAEEPQVYYVLKSLNSNGVTYVSTTNEAQLGCLRPVLSRQEIDALICGMPDGDDLWPGNERERNTQFAATLRTGNCHELVRMIKAIYLERDRKKEQGKRLGSADIKFVSSAEKLVHEEFAFVLGIRPEEVGVYILERIAGLPEGSAASA